MIEFKDLSEKSKKAYILNKTLLYLYYFMGLVLLFQFGRSIVSYHYDLLDIGNLIRVNTYLIGVVIMSPVVINGINYKIRKARDNEM